MRSRSHYRRRRAAVKAVKAGHLGSCGIDGVECDCLRVARHEAGHAVVALALGVRVSRIDLRPLRGDIIGMVTIEDTDRERDMLIELGGIAAELLTEDPDLHALADMAIAGRTLIFGAEARAIVTKAMGAASLRVEGV